MALRTLVDIENGWYGEPIASVASVATGLTGAEVKAFIDDAATKVIPPMHAKTFAYEGTEGSATDFIIQQNGTTYHRDYTPGAVNVNFTIGQYDFQTKADLQGGTATATGWKSPTSQGLIYKTMVFKTKDGTYIVFPKAQISARGGMIESSVIGLMLTATPLYPGIDGLSTESWFDGSVVV
jgi:hypothetical protein